MTIYDNGTKFITFFTICEETYVIGKYLVVIWSQVVLLVGRYLPT